MTPAINWTYRADVLDVVDADTLHILINVGFDLTQRMTVRLSGVDAPEVRLTAGVTEAEKRQGIFMADTVRRRTVGRRVIVVTERDRREKYGRFLATVWDDEGCLNDWVKDETERWQAQQGSAA